MSDKNNAKKLYTTPVGTVGAYPYLQKPDTGNEQFPKPRGEWSCKLAIPSDKAQKVINLIEKASGANYKNYLEVGYPKAVAEAKKAGKRPPKQLEERDYPFYEDDEGNVVFTFKGHASWIDKANGNEKKEITLRVYDSAGKRIENVPAINRNSEGRVEFSILPYQSAVAGVGVKLQLSKFQLLKLVEYSAGGNDTFGSDLDEEYEGGYTAPPADEFNAGSDAYDADADETPDADDDF